MAQYTTSREAMAAGAARVEIAITDIQGVIGGLRSEVETMMGGWRGDAASSFVQVHEAFEAQANKINTALRRMHESLEATHKDYSNQENTQVDALTGLAGQING